MSQPELGQNSESPFLHDTLHYLPVNSITIFAPGAVTAPDNLVMTIIPPEGGAYSSTTRQLADQGQAREVISEADVAVRGPQREPDSPAAMRKFNEFLQLKDLVEGNPRTALLEAANTIVAGRAVVAETAPDVAEAVPPIPELILTNAESGESTSVRVDVAEIIIMHPEILEETRRASKTTPVDESGERKVYLRLTELVRERAQEIGIDMDTSIGKIGEERDMARDTIGHVLHPAANHPLSSNWWHEREDTVTSGDHWVKDPMSALVDLQQALAVTFAGMRKLWKAPGSHEVTNTLEVELKSVPPFDSTFLELKEKVEAANRQLVLIKTVTNICLSAIPKREGEVDYEQIELEDELMDLAIHEDLRVVLETAADVFRD